MNPRRDLKHLLESELHGSDSLTEKIPDGTGEMTHDLPREMSREILPAISEITSVMTSEVHRETNSPRVEPGPGSLSRSLAETLHEDRDEVESEFPPELRQRRFMDEHTTCAMCDTKLEIRHQISMGDLKVKEEAHCPSCGIRVRSTHHLMH